jgi:hypothetical protein
VDEVARVEVRVEFATAEACQKSFDDSLSKGGVQAPLPEPVALRQLCDVVLVHPESGEELSLLAEAVWVGEGEGEALAAFQFVDFDEKLSARLQSFVAGPKEEKAQQKSVHERLRGLSAVEQSRIAREGSISERTALEKIYGKAVWEPLLRNPKLSQPEVARIARMGNLPRPLLEVIVGNAGWLSAGIVRRAVLSNPRMTLQMVDKVLRSLPKSELKMVPKQTVYPAQVKEAAKRLLARGR